MNFLNWTFIYTCENISDDAEAPATVEKEVAVLQFLQTAAIIMYKDGQLDVVPVYDLRKVM